MTPVLDGRARALQSELNEIQELRQEMARRRDELTGALAKLANDNQRLADLVAKKSGLRQSTLAETEATRQRLARLADQAKNLQDLISRLEQTETRTPTVMKPRQMTPPRPMEPGMTPRWPRLSRTQPKKPMRMKKPADLRLFPRISAN